MPCFKGLAVSIHTPDGPLPEHSIQRQQRQSRITSYIPVPPAKIPLDSFTNIPEQSTFAISITLLTPGLNVPYSTPKPTPDELYPGPQIVSGLPGVTSRSNPVGPYLPLTTSPNETIAAYIYFDGRQKEEVATLLRRGEETWVNSRWVGIPESEGGGLAEREFLFREVGLERWLNGLDLEGKDVAAKIRRRREKMEKKRRRRREIRGSDDEAGGSGRSPAWNANDRFDKGVLRYGANEQSPLEKLSDEDEMFSSEEESDDDPIPEATGQIKVALFRVLASGEIKKGEYSPQFDAHDDDEDSGRSGEDAMDKNGEGGSGEADIDHTTSFAKPKSLDPKSISTQTVTGIDGPDQPYAVFTFLYRGEKQLQKMGILKAPKQAPLQASKRRSMQTDFANIKPLKPGGAMGFSTFRDTTADSSRPDKRKGNKSKKTPEDEDAMDSDEDDEDDVDDDDEGIKKEDGEDMEGGDVKDKMLNPEDIKRQGELAEGVKKIKLKRQHSFDPPTTGTDSGTSSSSTSKPLLSTRKSLPGSPVDPSTDPISISIPRSTRTRSTTNSPPELLSNAAYDPKKEDESFLIGSPMKKARASLQGGGNGGAGVFDFGKDRSVFAVGEASRKLGLGLGLGSGVEGKGTETAGVGVGEQKAGSSSNFESSEVESETDSQRTSNSGDPMTRSELESGPGPATMDEDEEL